MSEILIIEDDREMAELEKNSLELGYGITVESDGRRGLELALSKDYALVILDVALPGLDGFSICGQIREKKEIPIIFVSARTEEIDIIKGFKAGADDYVTKPFSPIELVARVNANVARYRRLLNINNDNEVIRIRGLEIDRTARRVFVDGEERSFTSREFDLLSFLAQNPNRVFSKEELFRNIWNMESIGGIATVTVHIKKIREKLNDDTDNPKYIETIWGVGYRFRM